MQKLRYALVPVVALIALTPAVAAPTPVKPTEKISCSEFIALDDEFKPEAVSFVVGYDKAKRPEAKDIDVAGIEKVVPVLISSCRAAPTETLLQRLRNDLHSL